MRELVIKNIIRFVVIVLLQVTLFKNMVMGTQNFAVHVMLYPMILILLPFRVPHILLIFIGFVMGITIDLFYNSPGIHASASVFAAFMRPAILRAMEPESKYDINTSPTKYHLNFPWFILYASIMMFLHLAWYFSMEAFSVVYAGTIIWRTVATYFMSIPFIIGYQAAFNPK